MIEIDFRTALTSASGVSALVGSNIYPVVLPTDPTLPAIDYNIVAGSVDGTFNCRGTTKLRFEVNCWAADYLDAITLRSAVIDALDGLRTLTFVSRFLASQDFFEHDLLQYRACVEFYVWFNQ